jgi:hypothetical protein
MSLWGKIKSGFAKIGRGFKVVGKGLQKAWESKWFRRTVLGLAGVGLAILLLNPVTAPATWGILFGAIVLAVPAALGIKVGTSIYSKYKEHQAEKQALSDYKFPPGLGRNQPTQPQQNNPNSQKPGFEPIITTRQNHTGSNSQLSSNMNFGERLKRLSTGGLSANDINLYEGQSRLNTDRREHPKNHARQNDSKNPDNRGDAQEAVRGKATKNYRN